MDGIKSLSNVSGIKADLNLKTAEALGSTKSNDKSEAKKAATDFEALLLHQMLNSMWSTVPKDQLLGGSSEEAQYRDMYTEALAKDIAENQSLGVRDVLLKDFDKRAGAKTEVPS